MLIILPIIAAWILFLLLIRKLKIYFFVFVAGSIGLFWILMYIGRGAVEKYLEHAVAYIMHLISKFTGFYVAYPEYSMLTVYNNSQTVSFFVDYECSGFIETITYISLLAFYPIYRWRRKIILGLSGTLYIFLSNIIRVFIICVIVKKFGPSLFFFSHTVFARVLFFFLMVGLYYVVFTRAHILRQKVGKIGYEN